MTMTGSTHYERVAKITWNLDEAEMKLAIRNHVLASKLLVPKGCGPYDLEVEIQDGDHETESKALVTWRNVVREAPAERSEDAPA